MTKHFFSAPLPYWFVVLRFANTEVNDNDGNDNTNVNDDNVNNNDDVNDGNNVNDGDVDRSYLSLKLVPAFLNKEKRSHRWSPRQWNGRLHEL